MAPEVPDFLFPISFWSRGGQCEAASQRATERVKAYLILGSGGTGRKILVIRNNLLVFAQVRGQNVYHVSDPPKSKNTNVVSGPKLVQYSWEACQTQGKPSQESAL